MCTGDCRSKKTLKHFLPLKDMTTDVFTDDPADIFAGRTYSDLLTGTMFRVQVRDPSWTCGSQLCIVDTLRPLL